MNRSVSRLCLTAAISFIAGTVFVPLVFFSLMRLVAPGRHQQKMQAVSFFYRTMNSLFEGTYNFEEGSMSKTALENFRKYETQLGNKCNLFIVDDNPGYYECFAFFPSGDIFNLAIRRTGDSLTIEGFNHQDWDHLWRDVLLNSEQSLKS